MARMDTSGLDELISEMQRMGQDTGPVAEEMVEAAVEIIKQSWINAANEHGHVETGDMIGSIGYGRPVNAGNLIYCDVYPQGNDSKGVSNAAKAFILHYGKHNMPGTYWVDEAEMRAGPDVEAVCQAIWDRFLKSGSG